MCRAVDFSVGGNGLWQIDETHKAQGTEHHIPLRAKLVGLLTKTPPVPQENHLINIQVHPSPRSLLFNFAMRVRSEERYML